MLIKSVTYNSKVPKFSQKDNVTTNNIYQYKGIIVYTWCQIASLQNVLIKLKPMFKAEHCERVDHFNVIFIGSILRSNIIWISQQCWSRFLNMGNMIADEQTCVPTQVRIQGRWNGWIFTPLFLSPLLSSFFISLEYWNNIWFLWHYYRNSPPISKSWIRPC